MLLKYDWVDRGIVGTSDKEKQMVLCVLCVNQWGLTTPILTSWIIWQVAGGRLQISNCFGHLPLLHSSVPFLTWLLFPVHVLQTNTVGKKKHNYWFWGEKLIFDVMLKADFKDLFPVILGLELIGAHWLMFSYTVDIYTYFSCETTIIVLPQELHMVYIHSCHTYTLSLLFVKCPSIGELWQPDSHTWFILLILSGILLQLKTENTVVELIGCQNVE